MCSSANLIAIRRIGLWFQCSICPGLHRANVVGCEIDLIICAKRLRADKTVGAHEATGWNWLIRHVGHWRHGLMTLESHWLWLQKRGLIDSGGDHFTYQWFWQSKRLVIGNRHRRDVAVLVVAATGSNWPRWHHQGKAGILTFGTAAIMGSKCRIRIHHVCSNQALDLNMRLNNA